MANPPDSPMQRHLSTLADPPLPPALWSRVARARRRQLVHRRIAVGGGIAVAFALLLLPGGLPGPGVAPVPDPASQLASADPPPARAPSHADQAARLRILDRELQEAYRRGSGEAEIAQLWEARAALLGERTPSFPVRPVRI